MDCSNRSSSSVKERLRAAAVGLAAMVKTGKDEEAVLREMLAGD